MTIVYNKRSPSTGAKKPEKSRVPERVRHYQGEKLQARDLQEEWAGLAAMRGLHVAALHDTWGIALGFDVCLVSANGLTGGCKRQSTGPSVLLVGQGFGYDHMGREIILADRLPVPLPELEGMMDGSSEVELDLVVSYDPGIPHLLPGGEVALCEGRGGKERPLFRWMRPGAARLGLELPLARLRVTKREEELTVSLDMSVRWYAKALARPHIASGITPLGRVFGPLKTVALREGEPEFVTVMGLPIPNIKEVEFGWTMQVDTRDAGFVGIPFYIARLAVGEIDLMPTDAETLTSSQALLLTSVTNATATDFTFNVLPAYQSPPKEHSSTLNMRVSWVGIEPVEGCRPGLR